MVCDIITDFPERFVPGVRVFIGDPPLATEIIRARRDARTVTLALKSVGSRDEVEHLRDSWVLVQESDAHPLPEGQYYWHQLIGLRVKLENGDELGLLQDILETGSNHVYVVKSHNREMLLPAIPEVIVDVDVHQGVMTVHMLPGLDEI
jgi:16S rRNA processing protein RimM